AFLVAIGFMIYGTEVWVIRAVQVMLYVITIIITVLIGKRIWRLEVGLMAGLILAIPTVNTTLYTTVSLGGYGEALVLGNLSLLLTLFILDGISNEDVMAPKKVWTAIFALGVLIGFGWWVNGITLVYSLPALLMIFHQSSMKKKTVRIPMQVLTLVVLGFIIGAIPVWLYGYQNGFVNVFGELFGSAVSVEGGSLISRALDHTRNLLVLGFPVILGLRAPWEVRWLGIPLIPIVIIMWSLVFWFVVDQIIHRKHRSGITLLVGVCLALIFGFIFSSFGIDPSGRYFLPLVTPMALFCAAWMDTAIKTNHVKIAIILALVGYHVWGTLNCAYRNPPGITTQFNSIAQIDHQADGELIQFLSDQHEYYGYTNYWVAYPLAFHSDEKLIYIPRLPYHEDFRYTARDDRYSPYAEKVRQSDRVAYIVTHHAALNDHLRTAFSALQVSWKEETIGDYQIFYDLSEPVKPETMGLGQ
ncbi:MAG: hypothetical protein HPY76_14175, partial [Anaerolineae bacterium]|nr:hypothetical protein [Anaerolineae bacterium]